MIFSIFSLFFLLTFIIGFVLLIRGIRGRLELSEPVCAKCRYDLRAHILSQVLTEMPAACPECGSDLRKPRSVRFGQFRKSPRMIRWGACVLAIPLMFVAATFTQEMMGIRWSDWEPDNWIIARLDRTADTPGDWNKLEQRFRRGALSQSEIEAAIDKLINHVLTRKNRNAPLTWADQFLQPVEASGAVSPEQIGRLCEAFYGEDPTIKLPARIRAGSTLSFFIWMTQHWNLPGKRSVAALRQVRLNNGDILLARSNEDNDRSRPPNPAFLSTDRSTTITGTISDPIGPGRYEITFVIDFGVFKEPVSFRADRGKPGQKSQWPVAVHTWTTEVTVPLIVLDKNETIISLVTDPALKPATPTVSQFRLLPANGKSQLSLDLPAISTESVPVPLSFDVIVRIDGNEHTLGRIISQSGPFESNLQSNPFNTPPADIHSADIILRPNPRHVESDPEINRIWGEEIILKDVHLQRFDITTK